MFSRILSTPTAQLGRAARLAVFQVKLWSYCARLLRKNRSGQQAAALSFNTILGLVPLAIVTLLMFQSFGPYSTVGDKLKTAVYEELHLTDIKYPARDTAEPQKEIALTDYLDGIIEQFFTGVNKGSITIFSALVVIWAALSLLSTIERAFNNIWHVTRPRTFLQRMINYWALLTLAPLLLGAGIYITAQYSALGRLQRTIMSNVAPPVLSFIVAVVAFFLLYFVLPNTRVRPRAAIWGAAVAALVWMAVRGAFTFYVTEFKPYSTVYGMLALFPITVVWIFVTWLIVLFGLQLTFTTQNFGSLDAAQIAATGRRQDYFIADSFTAIEIMRLIAEAFGADEAPVLPEVICSKLNMPAEFGEKVLARLVAKRLLARCSEPAAGFVPARDPARIRLSDVAAIVTEASFARADYPRPRAVDNLSDLQRESLAKYTLGDLLGESGKVEE
jgi:membrane protein